MTREVGELSASEIAEALDAGARRARQCLGQGLIEAAALRLLGETAVVGTRSVRRERNTLYELATA